MNGSGLLCLFCRAAAVVAGVWLVSAEQADLTGLSRGARHLYGLCDECIALFENDVEMAEAAEVTILAARELA